ncbi:hypothetical protein OO17_24585 [Rhodopseudomonas palustris]|uniref:Uncharacterized protein n=1 Tax=Rhodopseudomonas palustris TaxID=1076 RepID=A0A0D7EAD7_RHOPL|nr:hypothetical protein OO17_24585 [Rhodopseudomonas palustris]
MADASVIRDPQGGRVAARDISPHNGNPPISQRGNARSMRRSIRIVAISAARKAMLLRASTERFAWML